MDKLKLINDWHRRSQESSFAHYEAASTLSKFHYYLGIPAVILSAVVGTTIFATLQESPNGPIQIAIGLLSMLTSSIVALQTFLRLDERASKHRSAGSSYGSIRRELQQIIYSYKGDTISDEMLSEIREKFDKLAMDSPNISERIWHNTEKKLARYNTSA